MRWYLTVLVLLVMVAGLAAAGCGDGGGDADGHAATEVSQGGAGNLADEGAREADGAAANGGLTAPPVQDDASGGKSAGVPANLLDRRIRREASLEMTVEDVTAGAREVERMAEDAGGYVAASASRVDGERRLADLTIRVPAERYGETMERLRGLAVEVTDERMQTQDVTEEYTDLEARLRNLQATEAQYLELLGRADEIGEVLQVQDRLNAVRGEIEVVEGRIQLLDQLTELATIDLTLAPAAAPAEEGGPPAWQPGRAVERAWDASLQVVAAASEAVIMAVVFSWWLLPMAVLALWLGLRWWRRGRGGRAADATGA